MDYLFLPCLILAATIIMVIGDYRLNKKSMREFRESHEREMQKINNNDTL